MTWRGDVKKHFENVDKAFDVLNLVELDNIPLRNGIRGIILEEMKQACKSLINWLNTDNNEYCKKASLFLENFELGYDICVIIEARCFIYNILDKSLYELLTVN